MFTALFGGSTAVTLFSALSLLPTVIASLSVLVHTGTVPSSAVIGHGQIIAAIVSVFKDLGSKATLDQILTDVISKFVPAPTTVTPST